MYKGVDRLGGREPVNNNAYDDGDMRESNMNTPNTEGGYPSNTHDANGRRIPVIWSIFSIPFYVWDTE